MSDGVLAKSSERLAEQVAAYAGPRAVQCKTRMNEANIEVQSWPVHSQYSAQKEAAKLVDEIDLNATDVVYCYGVGLGYVYDALTKWLQGDVGRFLVFLEDEESVLQALLETERGRTLWCDPQVHVTFIGKQEAEREITLQSLAQYFVGTRLKVTALPSYAQRKDRLWQQIQMILMHKSTLINFASQEFLRCGATFFRNFYRNVWALQDSYNAAGLFGKFKGIPAIIAGAGPSLNQNHRILKSLGSRALIFCGGSSVKALTGRGIDPHFSASCDPNATQFERMNTHTGYELPVFYKQRVFYRALSRFHGPKLHVSGNNGYPVTDWLEGELKIQGESPHEGFNVLHLLIDLARLMGCDPIIFVGMDLAFTGMQTYADAVVPDSRVAEKRITLGTDLNHNAFKRTGVDGNPVYTLWKWVAEADYTSKYVKSFPDTTFINATEGGLGIAGVPNVPLREVKEKYLTKEWDLRCWVHAEIQTQQIRSVDERSIADRLQRIEQSMERCKRHAASLKESFHLLQKAVTSNDLVFMEGLITDVQKVQKELVDELAYKEVLTPLNEIRSLMAERRWEQTLNSTQMKDQKERMKAVFRSQEDEAVSLHYCADVNLLLLRQALKEHCTRGADVVQFDSALTVRKGSTKGLEGVVEYHFSNGRVAAKAQWKGGMRHGATEMYFPNGQLYASLGYQKGQRHDTHTYFYPDGSRKSILPFKEGELHGTVVLYHSNGLVKKTVEFEKGLCHGVQRDWDEAGKPLSEIHWSRGQMILEQTWQAGCLVEERRAKKGCPQPDWRKWDGQGMLRFSEIYTGDRFVHAEWDEKGKLQKHYRGSWNGDFPSIEKFICGELKAEERERMKR